MANGDLGDLLQDRPELDVLQRDVPGLGHDLTDLLLELRQVDVGPLVLAGEHQRHVGEERDVLLPEGQQQQHQVLADLRPDLADHPEVQEVDAVVPPHQVARMRIGVEEAVHHDLAVVRLEHLPRRLLPRRPLGRVADGASLDLLHDQ